MDDSLSEICH